MKRKWKVPYISICMIICLCLMGVQFEGAWTKTLDSLPVLGVETGEFYKVPKIYIFSFNQEKFKQVNVSLPLLVQNHRTLISLKDMNSLIQQEKIQYNEETKIVTIQQIKRTYMAIDKAAYLEQDTLKPTTTSPTIKDGEVYVPLRFCLEKLGYYVNFNSYDSEILVVPIDKVEEEIVAKDKIRINKLEEQDSDIENIDALSFYSRCLLGIGSNKETLEKRIVRLSETGEISKSEESFESTEQILFRGEDEGNFYLQGQSKIVHLDLKRGLHSEFDIPKLLEECTFFGFDRGKFYAYDGKEVFSYDPNSKKTSKIIQLGWSPHIYVDEGFLFFNQNGILQSYSIESKVYKEIDRMSNVNSLEILDVRYPNLYYYNHARAIFEIYNVEINTSALSLPMNQKRYPRITLNGNNYVTVGKKNSVDLYDIGAKRKSSFDLTNIKEELNRGSVTWYWDGSTVLGHWKYGIELEEHVKDQIIQLQL